MQELHFTKRAPALWRLQRSERPECLGAGRAGAQHQCAELLSAAVLDAGAATRYRGAAHAESAWRRKAVQAVAR